MRGAGIPSAFWAISRLTIPQEPAPASPNVLPMRCPDCASPAPPSARFCPGCGRRLAARCACGAELPAEARFCAACGVPAAAVPADAPAEAPLLEGETRILTVVFADMSGSVETTRDLHPEDAANLVNELFTRMVDALVEHGGQVNRFLGDGALGIFGSPQAHENDPERAILAAMQIREAARQL